ncbi:uncharacterized protein EDB91DRAFT_1255596 [Suillus paluster]|uniref:uncharacterized protein n=1 Tax=Suillus paluster TaxID=48578 RepID=UPI001B86AB27|nr:uncharacterized protein EDB91DRAFT_1255596 [Suillus paluster]KAG1723522.1 hypothetical protein EDB91DRAFT_1255596 [Suillus paluster]
MLTSGRGANVPVPLLPYWDDSHVSVPPSPFAQSFFGASALLSIEIRAFSVVGASPSLYGRPPPFMAVPLAVTSSAFASVPPPYATVPVPLWPSPSLYGRPPFLYGRPPFLHGRPRPFMAVPPCRHLFHIHVRPPLSCEMGRVLTVLTPVSSYDSTSSSSHRCAATYRVTGIRHQGHPTSH